MITSTIEIMVITFQIALNGYAAKCVYPYEDRLPVILFHINAIFVVYNICRLIDIIV
jgi:hypothetical protein